MALSFSGGSNNWLVFRQAIAESKT